MANDHAFIHLVDHMGGDLAIVNAARVSYGKSSAELTDKDKGLIRRLMRDRHGTPFEQAVMTFYVRCPIFVQREWRTHRMGSFNEISARYSQLKTDFYTPKKFRQPAPAEKQMNYKYVDAPADIDQEARELVQQAWQYLGDLYDYLVRPEETPDDWHGEHEYEPGLGIAKEHARIVLPVSIYTEFRWTVNARALMNFLSLRNSPQAMSEIRMYAQGIEHIWAQVMPVTHAAFVEGGRVSP